MGFSTRFARPVGFLAVYAILVGIPGASAGTLLNNWSAMGKMFLYTQTGAVGIGSDFNATIIPKSRLDVDGDFNLRGNLVVDNSVQDNVLLLPSDSLNAFSVQDTLGNKYFTMDSDTNRIEIESILYMEKGIIEPSEFYGLSIQTRTSAKEFVKFDTINLWSSFMSPVTFESATALDRSIILQDGHADALFIKGEGDNGKVFVQYDTTIGGERVITQQNLVVLNGISNPEGPITVETAGDIYFKVPLGNKFGVQQNSQDRITVETDGSIIIASKSDKSITLTSGAGSKIEQIVGLGSEWRVQQYYDASNNANRMLITAAGSISLSAKDGETLSLIQGGTEIIKINADDSVTVAAVTTISGNTAVTSTTPASTSAAAALVVSGGVGVAEDVLIAGDLGVAGDAAIGVNLAVTGTTTLTGATRILSTTQSTAKTVGALVVNGGVGIALDVFIGGKVDVAANANVATTLTVGTTADITAATSIGGVLTVTNALNSSTKDNGAIHTDGGLGVTLAANIGTALGVGGITNITDITGTAGAATDSTGVTSGSLINNGGLGNAGAAFIGGVLTVLADNESADTSTGALKVTGGGVFGKKLRVVGDAFIGGALDSTGALTLASTLTSANSTPAAVALDLVTPNAGSILTNGGLGVKLNAFFGGALGVGGVTTISPTTTSTSITTGSLINNGGLGNGGDVFIGGNLNVAGTPNFGAQTATGSDMVLTGTLEVQNVTAATSATAGSVKFAGGLAIANNIWMAGPIRVQEAAPTVSDSTTTGSIVTDGGLGVLLDTFIGGKAEVTGNIKTLANLEVTGTSTLTGIATVIDTTESASTTTGSLIASGGLGVVKKAYIGSDASIAGAASITGVTSIAASTVATTTTSGSLINSGGLGNAGNAHIGGNGTIGGVLTVTNSLDSLTKDDGAIHTDGGLGVTKAAFIGTTLGVGGITTSTGVTSGSLINNGGLGNAGNAHIGGTGTIGGVLTVTSTAAATVATVGTKVTPDAGSIFTNGGLGVKKNAFIGGAVKVTDTTEATSTSAASLVTSGGLAVLLDARIGGTLHAGGFSTTNIAVGSGVAFTVTQGNVERFGFATTGSINVASASGQDITVTSGGNIDVTTAALMYAKFATPATTITSAPTASAATNSPTAAALAADSTNNYVKVYDGGVEVKTQTNLPLDLSSGGYLTATSAFGTSVSSSASLTLTLGTDTILSTDAGTGALTIASATTSTTAPKTTITGSKASADPTGTSGVRFGAEDRSKLDIDGEGIDIYACDSTGGTATSNCGDATLKGSGVLLQSVSGNGAVKIQAFTATTSGTSSTSTVQIKAISPKSATTDTSLLIQAMGTAVITDARASLLIQSGDTYAGEIRIQQRYVDGGQINADRFFVDVDGAVTITSEDSQPLTFAHDEVNGLVNTGEIRYRAGYDHTLYKQVDFSGGGTITVATVTLQPKQSVIVEIIIEGLWTSGASIHRAEYLIVHNNGNSPEPDGTSPISNNNLIVSTNTWTTGITTTVTTATKPFAITYLASGGTFLVSEPMNVIINVRGRFDSVT